MDDTMSDDATTDGLPGFDLSEDEAASALERFRRDQVKRDGRVCACGHPMTKHMELEIRGEPTVVCRLARLDCPCKDPKAVVDVSDTRVFLHKTKGRGAEHALLLGITALKAKGRRWRWIEEDGWPRCELAKWPEAECEEANGVRPYPVSVATGRLTDRQEPHTLLLCLAHASRAIEKGLPS